MCFFRNRVVKCMTQLLSRTASAIIVLCFVEEKVPFQHHHLPRQPIPQYSFQCKISFKCILWMLMSPSTQLNPVCKLKA